MATAVSSLPGGKSPTGESWIGKAQRPLTPESLLLLLGSGLPWPSFSGIWHGMN